MQKWEKFTEEELKEIFYSSKTAQEFAEKLGYKSRSITRSIKQKYSWCDFKERDNNLIGKRFGRLVVLECENIIDQERRWKCKCDCGNIVHNVFGYNLKSGNTKSCGCLNKELLHNQAGKKNNKESIVGQTFNYLTVLPEIEYFNGKPKNKCQCKCGNICYVSTNNIISGNTKSCGCLIQEKASERIIDLTGQTFGKLTILEPTEYRAGRNVVWKCQCECGNIAYINGNNLRNGMSQSCGCMKNISSSIIIETLLKELDVNYQKEYSFKDLRGDTLPLRFDYAILNDTKVKCLIEYQGKQHYSPIDFFGGEKSFEKQQEYDNKKRDYCMKNNIPLIEIPYYERAQLNQEYLLSKIGGYLNE